MRQVTLIKWHGFTLMLLGVLLVNGLAQGGTFDVSGRSEYRQLKARLRAANFLARATFAFTEADVDALAAEIRSVGYKRALSNWIDNQVSLPPTQHEPLVLQLLQDDGYADPYADRPDGASNRTNYRDFAFWQASLNAPDQLRQRVGFALMQIFVINRFVNIYDSNAADSSGDPRYTGIVHYYDTLLQHSFGNYKDVMVDVAYHPVMGIFLTHIDNKKPSADGLLLPDENFAREILQLFSMSEFRMTPDGTFLRDRGGNLVQNYTNEDIKALARVFTGLRYAVGNGTTSVNLHDPMEIRNFNDHDFDAKTLPTLGLSLPARTPSAENANAEIQDAIDYIFNHPNVGPYVSRILIQRLVKANPSKRYINDVAEVFEDNGSGVRGDLVEVVRTILCHNEALRSMRYTRVRGQGRQITGLRVQPRGTEYSKLVEPIVRYTQFIKVFGGQPVDPAKGERIRPDKRDLSQLPYEAPSVFNYFRPDHQPQGFQNYTAGRRIPNGELHSPEAQIYTPVFANRFQNLMYRHLHNNVSSYNSLDFSSAFAAEETLATQGLAAGDFSQLLQRLDLLMCHGSLSEASKTAINNALVSSGNTNTSELARLAIFGVFGTPECAIDE